MTAELWQPITRTPVAQLQVRYRGATLLVLLKQESANASGSVKARTAIGLLRSLDAAAPLTPGTVVVESTSGNLGIALAHQTRLLGCSMIAVIDPKTPAVSVAAMRAAGARIDVVDEPDGRGGYLLSRLARVRQLCADNPGYRWTNQYENPANPQIHTQTTGPEILDQGGDDLDTVYVAVSTGGTLAGIADAVRRSGRLISVVAVDAHSSLATAEARAADRLLPTTPGARLIPGIGASRPSSFLTGASYDRRVTVRDCEAIAVCRILRQDTAVGVGGSTGCVLRACVTELAGPLPPLRPLCVSPDDATRYEDTLYDDGWLRLNNLYGAVCATMAALRADGLTFSMDPPTVTVHQPAVRVDQVDQVDQVEQRSTPTIGRC